MNDGHIIQKQVLDIEFGGLSDSMGIQEIMRDTYYDTVLPEIEKVFDEIVPGRYRVTIERLEIDCGELDGRDWQQQLVEEISRQLRKDLLTRHKKENDKAGFEDLLAFLASGQMPWNIRHSDLDKLEQSIEPRPKENEIRRLKELIKSSPDAARRVVYRFSEKFFTAIIGILTENKTGISSRLMELTAETIGRDNLKARAVLLQVIAADHADTETAFTATMTPPSERRKTLSLPGNPGGTVADSASLYVENAGLVLLHPFLPELFRRIGLLEGKHWKNSASQHLAVHVLEYLAAGEQKVAEQDAALNKILSGMNVEAALEPVDLLEDPVRKECDELLREVIRHWSKLKNTSIATLRASFLHRNGKLTSSENGWIMVVEQKGLDILLDSLPWGIGTIRLPWTEKTIHVEWI